MSEVREMEWIEVSKLKPSSRNARTHTAKQIDQIARSIDAFGFANPIIMDGEGIVVAGHGRLAAAKKLGLAKVPVIALRDLSKTQIQAYALADNKIALNAG